MEFTLGFLSVFYRWL